PMFLVDIAVPRDIEAEVDELSDAYLYTVDDLQGIIEQNLETRKRAAAEAELIVQEERDDLHGLVSQPALGGFSSAITATSLKQVADEELQRALLALQQGENAEQALKALAHRLTNKLIHAPTQAPAPCRRPRGITTSWPSCARKLEGLIERHEEVQAMLGEPDVAADQDRYRALTREYAQLEDIVHAFQQFRQAEENLDATRQMLEEDDADLREMAQEELPLAKATFEEQEQALQGWRVSIVSCNDGEHGGYKEVIAKVEGEHVYGRLKFESGGHRVQRVPETESQGRVHTSACTVAVLPEVPEAEQIEINPSELKIDTFRASGAGGQHVNKTDSAIRITHLPTGLVVECQDERSQHKNRAKAMSVLSARLQAAEDERHRAAEQSTRRNLVGSGDRSERIAPTTTRRGRLSEHRINLTLYRLGEIMEGDLDCVISPMIQEYQADQLASLAESN
ncbi:UNVERIFIED_CONTAM: hypothetical protein K2H54_000313, partial [Gekko kuhli]